MIGKIELHEQDIVLPMSFSYNSIKGPTYAGLQPHGSSEWEILKIYQEEIMINYGWGFAGYEISAETFLKNNFKESIHFNPCDSVYYFPQSYKEEKLINPNTIFNKKEVEKIFKLMSINSKIDQDDFNSKYFGLTRKEYLQKFSE